MLSSVSGIYFAGHLATVPTTIVVDPNIPLSGNLVVFYDMANSLSYSSGSTSVVSLTNIKNTAIVGGSNPFSNTVPKSMVSIKPNGVELISSTTATMDVGDRRSYSFWVKYDSPSVPPFSTELFTQFDSSQPNNSFTLNVAASDNLLTSVFKAVIGGTVGTLSMSQSSGDAVAVGSWTMVSVVLDYSNISYLNIAFYINGEFQSGGSSQGLGVQYNPGPVQSTRISMDSVVTPSWSKFMMWNAGLNSTQLAQLYDYQKSYYILPPAKATDTIINYDFNYGSFPTGTGTTVLDVSGNGYNATLSSSSGYVYTTGTPNTMRLISPTSMTALAVPGGLCTPSDTKIVQFNIWLYPTIFTTSNTVFDYRSPDGGRQGIIMGIISGGSIFFTFSYEDGGFNQTIPSGGATVFNKWNMITVNYGERRLVTYLNGVQIGSTNFFKGFSQTVPMVLSGQFSSGTAANWNAFEMYNYAKLDPLAKFNAEKSYYGL